MRGKILLYTPITAARQQLTIELAADWREEYEELKDSELDITIKKHRPKRSKTANAYMWELIGQIAEKTNLTADEVYRSHIKEVGLREYVEVNPRVAVVLENTWKANGTGWFTDVVDKTEKRVVMCLYFGSSCYNTKAFSRLIDNVVQDAKSLGITTETPEEIERLKSLWQGQY